MIFDIEHPSYIKKKNYFESIDTSKNTPSSFYDKNEVSYLKKNKNDFNIIQPERMSDALIRPDTSFEFLQDAVDIFSKIPPKYFIDNQNEQLIFINNFLSKMKNTFYEKIKNITITEKLPKLNIEEEENDTLNLNVITQEYRIYISFQKEVSESYYGYFFTESDMSMKIGTDLLSKINENELINLFISSIITKRLSK